MTGVFEVLANDDFDERRNTRKAVAVANRRAQTRFAGFLNAASDKDDFEARMGLIDDDLQHVVGEVTDEFEVNVDPVLSTVRQQLLAAGGFCDDCRKWKSGPKAGCTCHSAEGAEEESSEKTAGAEPWQYRRQHPTPNLECKDCGALQPYEGEYLTGCVGCGGGNMQQTDRDIRDSFSQSPYQALPERLQQNGVHPDQPVNPNRLGSDNTGLADAPSPKMDKTRWKPNALNDKGNLKPIDTDEGTRWPTEQQDITQSADHTKDFLEQTDAAAKHDQNVEKEWSGELLHTDTWSGTEGLADPVTSSVHTANQDVPTTWSQWGMHAGVNGPLVELNQACQALGGELTINGQPYTQVATELTQQGQGLAGQSVTVGAPHPVIAKGAAYIIQTGGDQGPDGAPISKKIVNAIIQQQQGGGGAPGAPAQQPAPQQAMSAVDPDKNPIRELLESNYDGFIPTAQVDAAITAHRNKSK